ncbi:MAG: hypothetical protein U9N38_07230, partial [Thermodesulfobacteriota bacterium]|nr:hypothetical protein [Thermodesulfobacteriota bacterium]
QSKSKVLSSAFRTEFTTVVILARPPDNLPPQPRRGVTWPNRSPVKRMVTVLSLPAVQVKGRNTRNITDKSIEISFFKIVLLENIRI